MRIALTLCALLLASCATEPEARWYKAGANQQDFEIDQGQCHAQAFQMPGSSLQRTVIVYTACMRGKGWVRR